MKLLKILPIFIIILLSQLSIASVQDSGSVTIFNIETYYSFYKHTSNIDISLLLKNEDGAVVTGATCTADILYPNKTMWVNDMNFTEYGNGYYYNNTHTCPSTGGDYFLWVNCTNSHNNVTNTKSSTMQIKTWINTIDDISNNQTAYFSDWNTSFYLWNNSYFAEWNGSLVDLSENWNRVWEEFDCEGSENEICEYLEDIEKDVSLEGYKTRSYIDIIVEDFFSDTIFVVLFFFVIIIIILIIFIWLNRNVEEKEETEEEVVYYIT